jgi:hypothetical protein
MHPQDLKQRVCGDMIIDADVLERNTIYEYGPMRRTRTHTPRNHFSGRAP